MRSGNRGRGKEGKGGVREGEGGGSKGGGVFTITITVLCIFSRLEGLTARGNNSRLLGWVAARTLAR